jgi:hypothetical protein
MIKGILSEQDQKINNILSKGVKKPSKGDKCQDDEIVPVFFSLKDHFDGNMGENGANKEEKQGDGMAFGDSQSNASDDDGGFFDASDTWGKNSVVMGERSIKYNPK